MMVVVYVLGHFSPFDVLPQPNGSCFPVTVCTGPMPSELGVAGASRLELVAAKFICGNASDYAAECF